MVNDGRPALVWHKPPAAGWGAVASGAGDPMIQALAEAYRGFGREVLFTFHHEPHDDGSSPIIDTPGVATAPPVAPPKPASPPRPTTTTTTTAPATTTTTSPATTTSTELATTTSAPAPVHDSGSAAAPGLQVEDGPTQRPSSSNGSTTLLVGLAALLVTGLVARRLAGP